MSRRLIAARMFETPHNVAERMKRSGIRHMPVVDERGELLGILSDRDLLRAQGGESDLELSDLVTRHTTWVHPDTPAGEAVTRMLEQKVGSLPVLENNRLVGIVTETDFMLVAQRALRWLEVANDREALASLRRDQSELADHIPCSS